MSPTDPVGDHALVTAIGDVDRLKLLIDALKHYQDGFTKSAYSSMGFLLLVAGWLMTSKPAREFLVSEPTVGRVGIAVMALSAAGYLMMSLRIQRLSQGIADRLTAMP